MLGNLIISGPIALNTQFQVTYIPALHFDTVRSAQCKTKSILALQKYLKHTVKLDQFVHSILV